MGCHCSTVDGSHARSNSNNDDVIVPNEVCSLKGSHNSAFDGVVLCPTTPPLQQPPLPSSSEDGVGSTSAPTIEVPDGGTPRVEIPSVHDSSHLASPETSPQNHNNNNNNNNNTSSASQHYAPSTTPSTIEHNNNSTEPTPTSTSGSRTPNARRLSGQHHRTTTTTTTAQRAKSDLGGRQSMSASVASSASERRRLSARADPPHMTEEYRHLKNKVKVLLNWLDNGAPFDIPRVAMKPYEGRLTQSAIDENVRIMDQHGSSATSMRSSATSVTSAVKRLGLPSPSGHLSSSGRSGGALDSNRRFSAVGRGRRSVMVSVNSMNANQSGGGGGGQGVVVSGNGVVGVGGGGVMDSQQPSPHRVDDKNFKEDGRIVI
eukprot:PhM_4_TR11407/c0_g1_i1/m.71262